MFLVLISVRGWVDPTNSDYVILIAFFDGKNGYGSAPQCWEIPTLPVFFCLCDVNKSRLFSHRVGYHSVRTLYLAAPCHEFWMSKYSRTPIIRTPVIRTSSHRIGLAVRVNLSRIRQNHLPWNYRLSDQVQYSVMACRTADLAWSKRLRRRDIV
jgi:hypothetical protein